MRALGGALEQDDPEGHYEAELVYDEDIGWDSVLDLSELSPTVRGRCQERVLNKRAKALFLPPDFPSPLTNIVSIKFHLKYRQTWRAIVGTIYPGPLVPQLLGNMTEEQGLVWLGWDNPGEPI